MSKSTMNMDRFEQLVSAYGANMERWPDDEEDEALRFAATSNRARELLNEAALLDQALDSWEVEPPESLKDRILARIPAGSHRDAVDRFLDWLLPEIEHAGTWIWRPALLAGIALTLGIVLGSTVSLDAMDESDLWQEELNVMALNTNNGGSDR